MVAPLLSIEKLSIVFAVGGGMVHAVTDASLLLEAGEVLGIVGESGSGKSVMSRAILGLIPRNGKVSGGKIYFKGRDISAMSARELRELRMNEVSMVFQDSGSSLNPVFTVGQELVSFLCLSRKVGRKEARIIGTSLLERVGISDPARRMDSYPHELSGGQKQRVMIAMAIANRPSLLLADEPTTALDVTIQDQILRLLIELQREIGMSIVLVSHNIGIVSRLCTKVAVMYAGRVMEVGSVRDLIDDPFHPYTQALLSAVPRVANLGNSYQHQFTIPGAPPDTSVEIAGCPFSPRCERAEDACESVSMKLAMLDGKRATACPRPVALGGHFGK